MKKTTDYLVHVWRRRNGTLFTSEVFSRESDALEDIRDPRYHTEDNFQEYSHTIHGTMDGQGVWWSAAINLEDDARAYAAEQRRDQRAENAERRSIRDRQL